MDKNIQLGWGLDDVWATQLLSDAEPKKLAVIDEIVIIHTKPVGKKYPKGVNPHQEMKDMQSKYKVKKIIDRNPKVFPTDGNPYKHITIECVTKLPEGNTGNQQQNNSNIDEGNKERNNDQNNSNTEQQSNQENSPNAQENNNNNNIDGGNKERNNDQNKSTIEDKVVEKSKLKIEQIKNPQNNTEKKD